MSENLHVIYRETSATEPGAGRWSSYSYPHGIYAAGQSLEQVRAEFLEAAHFHFDDDELGGLTLFEHIEKPLIEGAFIRVAVDRRSLDRDVAAAAMRRSLTVLPQFTHFTENALSTAMGDAVVVACTPIDRLGWLFEQMGPRDALQICVAAPGELVWWSAIAYFDALSPSDLTSQPSIADLGLSDSSTVADFMRHKTEGDRHPVRVPASAW